MTLPYDECRLTTGARRLGNTRDANVSHLKWA